MHFILRAIKNGLGVWIFVRQMDPIKEHFIVVFMGFPA